MAAKKVGHNCKYQDVIVPNIEKIEKALTDGATYTEIAKCLKINIKTLLNYIAKAREKDENYKELTEALIRAEEIQITYVENALLKACRGYQWIERITETVTDKNGNQSHKVRERLVDVAPNPNAITFYLTNKLPSKWKKEKIEVSADLKDSGVVLIPEVKIE